MLLTQNACGFGEYLEECLMTVARGSCDKKIPRWYFDNNENACKPFYYTGCGANSNNYETQESCEAKCPPKRSKHETNTIIDYIVYIYIKNTR